jgi:hypothetical protein
VVIRPQVELERYFGYWSPGFALLVAAGAWFAGSGVARIASDRAVVRAAVATVLLVALGGYWLRQDPATEPGGFGERLAPLNAAPARPVYVVGADAEMFQFYVSRWQGPLRSVGELEHLLLFGPSFRVAYHDVEWDSPEHRQMRELLRRRCKGAIRGNVSVYECGE